MPRTTNQHSNSYPLAKIFVAPLGVLLLAVATSSVRQEMGLVNVALAMAAVTTIAAIVDWRAGIISSITAALAINYFHTEPVHSLRITDGNDIWTVALLGILGLGVSASTAARVRNSLRSHHGRSADAAAVHLLSKLFVDRPVAEVWHDSVDAFCAGLSMVNVRVDPGHSTKLPVISRQISNIDDVPTSAARVVLPECGAIVEFRNPKIRSRLILTPQPKMGSIDLDRALVFAFADQIEKTL